MKSGHQPGRTGFLPTRASLLRRLRDWRDESSWNDFARTYSRFLRGMALKAGLTEADADDVVQETMVAVAKKMPDFKYDPAVGSFKNFLALIAKRRIADHIRRKHYHSGEACRPREERVGTSVIARHPAPDGFPLEQQWQEEWSRSLFDVAAAKVKDRVRNLEYQMFYLHVVKQLPVVEVSKRLGVKRPQVYFAKYKVSALLRREIKRLDRQLF